MSDPRVGVGVFLFQGQESTSFILGKRKGSHGAGTLALPGGHLEHGESFETCAAREVLEETGLTISDIRFLTATNSVFAESGKHYVTIFMTALVSGDEREPQLLEPEKCEGWFWTTFAEMREMHEQQGAELFVPLVDLIEARPEECARLARGRAVV